MATIHIPALLKHLTGNVDRVDIDIPPGERRSVREVISLLDRRYPGLQEGIMLDGDLSPSIAVFIDDEQALMGLDAKVTGEDEVFFIPPIVGG